jgi:hypothetical protein
MNKRAIKLFCAMLDSIKSRKEWNEDIGGGIDKELSKRDCFKRVTEEEKYAKRSNDVY